jgi:hypothetical protein
MYPTIDTRKGDIVYAWQSYGVQKFRQSYRLCCLNGYCTNSFKLHYDIRLCFIFISFFTALQPLIGQGPLIAHATRSPSDTPQSVHSSVLVISLTQRPLPDRLYDMIRYGIFINCSWLATRWQQFSTHLHTNSTQNDTKQTIHRTTQKFRKRLCFTHYSYYTVLAISSEIFDANIL